MANTIALRKAYSAALDEVYKLASPKVAYLFWAVRWQAWLQLWGLV